MEPAYGGLVQWLESSEAALGILIAVVGGAASGWFSWHQRNLARRERAADLFDRFYSPEGYHAMVEPVFVVTLRWYALRGESRRAYVAALCKGWTGQEHAGRLLSAYVGESAEGDGGETGPDERFERIHFHRTKNLEAITEHAALTAFLYFWVKLQAMVDANLVCRRLTRELFRQPYAIYAPFIADFRRAVLESPETGEFRPAWVDATRRLEKLLLGGEIEGEVLAGRTSFAPAADAVGIGPAGD